MGIISKLEKNKQQSEAQVQHLGVEYSGINQEVVLTDQEVDFILLKLRESTYKGYEFEKYVAVYNKLSSQILKK